MIAMVALLLVFILAGCAPEGTKGMTKREFFTRQGLFEEYDVVFAKILPLQPQQSDWLLGREKQERQIELGFRGKDEAIEVITAPFSKFVFEENETKTLSPTIEFIFNENMFHLRGQYSTESFNIGSLLRTYERVLTSMRLRGTKEFLKENIYSQE